jgi:hypothetical protein
MVGYLVIPGSPDVVPNYTISNSLLNSFEPDDNRKVKWISSNLVDGQSYSFPYKYKQGIDASDRGEYDMVLRLAEQYLIRAEARAEQGESDGALSDVNIIRNRAGLSGLINSDKDSMLVSITHERQCELFAEWGHRWMDLKRTGQIDAVLGAEKPAWKNTSALLPIPLVELGKNPKLYQNPGY